MASSSSSFVTRALKQLGSVVKLPWKITGPASAPDFLESLVQAGTYRPIAPASQTIKAIIPHANPGNVYDIRYFNRDIRRAEVIPMKELIDPSSPFAPPAVTETSAEGGEVPAGAEAPPSAFDDLPPVPGKYYVMGKEFHINDVAGGDGYGR